MTHHLLELVEIINKNKATHNVIRSITERFDFIEKNNAFDNTIEIRIVTINNFITTFKFCSENAARNGLLTIHNENKVDILKISKFCIEAV